MYESKSKPCRADYVVAVGDIVYHSAIVGPDFDRAEYDHQAEVYAKHWGLELVETFDNTISVGGQDLKALSSEYCVVDVEKFKKSDEAGRFHS